jgi:hypothetical protein
VLQGGSGRIQITYSFRAGDTATELRRELEFHAEDFSGGLGDPSLVQTLMHDQSELALQKLKALVEAILQKEAQLEIGE